MNKKNILIACGGTGGHLFPGIAVAQELIIEGHHPILLISQKDIDKQASEKYGDIEFIEVPAIAKPPIFSLQMPRFICKLISTYRQSKRIIKEADIDIVLGMGGFTSLPPIRAGYALGKSCYIHESNALPGKANRLAAKWCKKILIGLSAAAKYLPKSQCSHVGTPVRQEMKVDIDKQSAREQLGLKLPPEQCLILTLGGSQGAINLNTRLIKGAKKDPDTHYLIIAGRNDHQRAQELAGESPNITIMGFCSQMATAYAACDGVIARAGAATLCELAELGKASLLIPFPFAADDHQSFNAEAYAEHRAAVLCPQQNLNEDEMNHFVYNIVKNTEKRHQVEQAIKQLSHPHAAQAIAREILN